MNASDLYCKVCGCTNARCQCVLTAEQQTGLRLQGVNANLYAEYAKNLRNNGNQISANSKQVGGEHYDKTGEQHWDRIYRLYGRGYFIGCATKYAERYHLKNGKQDLEKSIHFLQKLIELEYPEPLVVDGGATSSYVNQDR